MLAPHHARNTRNSRSDPGFRGRKLEPRQSTVGAGVVRLFRNDNVAAATHYPLGPPFRHNVHRKFALGPAAEFRFRDRKFRDDVDHTRSVDFLRVRQYFFPNVRAMRPPKQSPVLDDRGATNTNVGQSNGFRKRRSDHLVMLVVRKSGYRHGSIEGRHARRHAMDVYRTVRASHGRERERDFRCRLMNFLPVESEKTQRRPMNARDHVFSDAVAAIFQRGRRRAPRRKRRETTRDVRNTAFYEACRRAS